MAVAPTRRPRPSLPGGRKGTKSAGHDIAAMIRVDHAGEFGALRIYAGQLAVLSRLPGAKENAASVAHMAAQEKKHFDSFSEMVKARSVRPTVLEPIWQVAGYALGAATALMGEKAAMACTVAVEDVIDEHYAGQIEKLSAIKDEAELKETVERFRQDELDHRAEALARGAEQAPFYGLLSSTIRLGCRTAIRLSERI
nr:MAG: demethoxyubiquinone hydroxylase family protein [Hyphomicrobiales bacterium]